LKLNESSKKFEQDFRRAMEKGTNEILNIENEHQGFDEFKHIEEVLLEIEKVKQDLIGAKGTKEFKLEEFVEKAVEDQKATASALQKLLEDSPSSELKEKGKKLVGKAQELLNNPDCVPELIKDFMEIRAEESKIIQDCLNGLQGLNLTDDLQDLIRKDQEIVRDILENLPEAMKTEDSAGLKDRIDELLKENPLKIQVYLNLRLAETELLKDLTTTPIQTYEILFKILILSDKL